MEIKSTPLMLIQIIKALLLYFILFNAYCSYLFISNGLLKKISQAHPLLVTQIIFYITGVLYYIAIKKRQVVVGLFAILFSVIILFILNIVKTTIFHYFDTSKDCDSLVKTNPLYELFIDRNIDYYFNQTSTILCSSQCPCKWVNKTDIYNKNPNKFIINKYDGFKNAQECGNYMNDTITLEVKISYLQTMIQLEGHGCSGYCSKNDIYSVTDINKGVPKNSCFDVHRKIQKKQYGIFLLGFYSLMGVFLILMPSTCYLLYQFSREITDKEDSKNNMEDYKNNKASIPQNLNTSQQKGLTNKQQQIKEIKKYESFNPIPEESLTIQRRILNINNPEEEGNCDTVYDNQISYRQ